ncbi:MAG: PmeII family type II restriction endonuclease [Aquificaceae bacterium]|nr:PmeII family type II restriction endonuclease [Aquificaceae bacterium]
MQSVRVEDLLKSVKNFVEETIEEFHQKKIEKLVNLDIKEVISRKNPYLYKAKGLENAYDIVKSMVDYYLASQEETLFGNWLEKLAIYVCNISFGGVKSSTEGIDLEFERDSRRYYVSIKSGPNWGNSNQLNQMKRNFESIKKRLPEPLKTNAIFVEGCCYGRCGIQDKGIYYKYCGKDFWELISGVESFYIDIVEPIGYRAKEKNESYRTRYDAALNRLVKEFVELFCRQDGSVDWQRVVRFTSERRYRLRRTYTC